MSFDVNNPYFRTKVLTASPEELRLMLLDGALRFMRDGRDGLAEKDYEKVYDGMTKAKDILMELINSLRPEVDPDLCAKLSGLYTFMYNELTVASFEKDVAKVDEVIRLMEYERETWALLMEKLGAERSAGGGGGAGPRATAGGDRYTPGTASGGGLPGGGLSVRG